MSISADDIYYFGPSHFQKKRIHLKSSPSTRSARKFGLTICGEKNCPPFSISSVLWNCNAYQQGIRSGDRILSINQIPSEQFSHLEQIEKILNENDEIDIEIENLRRNPIDERSYDWIDPLRQSSTSPPPSNYLSKEIRLSYPERFVEIEVEKGKRLGLVIRGGIEFGLGIFISSIDRNSLCERQGLRIGDQILSVNGKDFRQITHEKAVEILRQSSQLSIHLRQINKLPQPKEEMNSMMEKDSINRWSKISDEILLNEYLSKKICVEEFLQSISRFSPQSEKMKMLGNVRRWINPCDIDRYEIFLLKEDLNQLKLFQRDLITNSSRSAWKRSLNANSFLHLSKSVENVQHQDENRRQSFSFNDENEIIRNSFEGMERNLSPFKRSFSIDFDSNDEKSLLTIKKSQLNLTGEENLIIEQFLQDYSSSYPLTIHKVRSTLGIAIEGGFGDRIPLPRIVYIQPDGSAYLSSGLRVGHVLIALNGYSLKGLRHGECALFIASTFKDRNRSEMNFLVVQPRSS